MRAYHEEHMISHSELNELPTDTFQRYDAEPAILLFHRVQTSVDKTRPTIKYHYEKSVNDIIPWLSGEATLEKYGNM